MVLTLIFVAFVMERLPPAIVAACGAAIYMVLGFVETDEVMAVLGNGALATIAAMFVLSGALVRTGTLEAVGDWVTRHAASRPLLAVGMMLAGTMIASAFMNNTPVTLVLIPVMIRLAGAIGWAPSRLLIPLSYAAILGGTCTLIGTSTNLVVAGIAQQAGLAPFSIFAITPIGVATAMVGGLAMLVLGRFLLPDRVPITTI